VKVRDLIRDLLDTDMNAEVMISAPLECSQSDPRPGHLSIPSLGIRTGTFQGPGSEPAVGSPWVMVQGTSRGSGPTTPRWHCASSTPTWRTGT